MQHAKPLQVSRATEDLDGEEHGDEQSKGTKSDFQYDVARPVRVVLWTDFHMLDEAWLSQKAPNCHVDQAYTDFPGSGGVVADPDYDLSDADVVVVNLAELERRYVLPRSKREGQMWIATCWEPPSFNEERRGDCSLLSDNDTMRWFDGVASYQNDSSLFPAFFTPPPEDVMRRKHPTFRKRSKELATFVSSDCRWAWRNDWVQAVNESLVKRGYERPILSWGECFHNFDEPSCDDDEAVQVSDADPVYDWSLPRFSQRCLSRRFALIAENTLSPWYVTEKIWNALAAGSIPVYNGADEAKLLVPPGSTLFVSDYNSTDELVDDMLAIAEGNLHHGRYKEATAWKKQPVESWGGWQMARRLSRFTLVPRLCEAAARRPPPTGDAPANPALPRSSYPPPESMLSVHRRMKLEAVRDTARQSGTYKYSEREQAEMAEKAAADVSIAAEQAEKEKQEDDAAADMALDGANQAEDEVERVLGFGQTSHEVSTKAEVPAAHRDLWQRLVHPA